MIMRVVGLVWLLSALCPATLLAQVKATAVSEKDKIEAKTYYEQGSIHFNLDEWAPAIEDFKAAYRLYPDPNFLYNIAQCYRKLGHAASAASYYKKYLRENPEARNREYVEKLIEELDAAPEQGLTPAPEAGAAATLSLDDPKNATAIAETATPPLGQSAPVVAAPTPADSLHLRPPTTPPAKPESLFRRWWFWTAAASAVATGIVVAVLATSSSSPPAHYQGTLNPPIITVPR